MFSLFHKHANHRRALPFLRCLSLMTLTALPLSLGCARLPPNQSTLSGRRIRVRMTFSGDIQPNYYYFFLINRVGTQGVSSASGAHGPVPVLEPSVNGGYGNGFATGSPGSGVGTINGVKDYGITDFVLYHAPAAHNNLLLYHFSRNDTPDRQPLARLITDETPLSPNLPQFNTTEPNDARSLSFDIDLAQLITDTNDTATKIQEAKNLEFIQVNIVATNIAPVDQTTILPKLVDSFGDTRNTNEQSSFLEIDLRQSRTYRSSDTFGQLSTEPTEDLFVTPGASPNNSLDLESWSIEVLPTQ